MSVGDSTQQLGTPAAGFRVTHAVGGHVLQLEGWGYWDSKVSSSFARKATSACRELAPPVQFVLDATRLKTQGADGQGALRTVMRLLAPLTLREATIHASNILVRMQLTRLARECSLEGRLSFDDKRPSLPAREQ